MAVNCTENGQKMSKNWKNRALIKINSRMFHLSFFNSVLVFGKLKQLSLTYLPVFRSLQDFTPKRGVKVGQYFKNRDFCQNWY